MKQRITFLSQKMQKHPLLLILSHFAFLVCLYLLLYSLGIVKVLPNNNTLYQWDSGWYRSIVENGYVFIENQQCNLAFYPLYPYLWKLLGVNNFYMSLINLSIFIGAFALLARHFKFSTRNIFLFLSFPSLFFCYVPYTEATFFFSSTLLLIGLYKHNLLMASAGIFLASLCRSASLVLFPVLAFGFIMELSKSRAANKKVLYKYFVIFLASLIGSLAVYTLQYYETGEFFAILEVLKTWDKELRIPQLPLTTWGAGKILWLDSSAFLTGFFALVFVIKSFVEKIKDIGYKINPAFTMSMGYLAVVTFYMLMYAGLDGGGGTSIFSLNRYVFATPFFTIFLFYIFNNVKISKISTAVFAASIFIVFTLYGFLGHSYGALKGNSNQLALIVQLVIVFVFALLVFLMSKPQLEKKLSIPFYIINVFLQIHIFHLWIRSAWIG
jgi:hypothetical protein